MGIHIMPPLFELVIKPRPPLPLTYYPETGVADANGPRRIFVSETWADIHDTASGVSLWGNPYVIVQADDSTNKWRELGRGIICFNSAGRPSDIQSAKVRLYVSSRTNQFATATSMGLYLSTPTDPASIAIGDYNKAGSVLASGTHLALSAGAYDVPLGWVEFPLNAAGLAAIVDGVSKFGIRLAWDTTNSPPAWVSLKIGAVYCSGIGGGANKPQLVVNY